MNWQPSWANVNASANTLKKKILIFGLAK